MPLNFAQEKLFTTITTLGWEGILRVSGAGGTGKTHTVSAAITHLLEKNPELKIAVVTVTHQALANISSKISGKVDFFTLAKFLNKGLYSPTLGSKVATKGNINRCSQYGLLVIDESSMVGQKESQLIINSGIRVIEMGDFAQLPPVMAKPNAFATSKNITEIHLSEPMRNGGEIHRVASVCRDHIYYPADTHDNVLVHEDQETFLKEFLKKLKTTGVPTSVVYLSYTNKRAEEVAKAAHTMLYGNKPFVEGQWLRAEQNMVASSKGHNVLVLKVGEKLEIQGVPCQMILVRGNRGECWITALLPGSKAIRDRRLESLIAQVKEANKAKNLDLVKVLVDAYEELEQSITMVASPFSLTIHKSQGQSIPFVFMDTQDVAKGKGGFKKNLLYVGYSRASKELNTIRITTETRTRTADPINKEYADIRELVPRKSHKDKVIKEAIKKKYGKFNCASTEGKRHFVEVYKELVNTLDTTDPLEEYNSLIEGLSRKSAMYKKVKEIIKKTYGVNCTSKEGRKRFVQVYKELTSDSVRSV